MRDPIITEASQELADQVVDIVALGIASSDLHIVVEMLASRMLVRYQAVRLSEKREPEDAAGPARPPGE